MAITALVAADKIRFEDLNGSIIAAFDTVLGDEFNLNEVKSKTDVVVPIYGSPYLRFENPLGSHYNKGVITVEGTVSALETLSSLVTAGGMKKVRLLVGGTNIPLKEYFQCVVTGVQIKRDLIKGDNFASGQISLIKI